MWASLSDARLDGLLCFFRSVAGMGCAGMIGSVRGILARPSRKSIATDNMFHVVYVIPNILSAVHAVNSRGKTDQASRLLIVSLTSWSSEHSLILPSLLTHSCTKRPTSQSKGRSS